MGAVIPRSATVARVEDCDALRELAKLGLNDWSTAELVFDGVFVPSGRLLGGAWGCATQHAPALRARPLLRRRDRHRHRSLGSGRRGGVRHGRIRKRGRPMMVFAQKSRAAWKYRALIPLRPPHRVSGPSGLL
jgi:alkylation response protein AidB-like acyl-CoA dehydrogenase